MHPLLFPPALIKRSFDDLGAIAHAARQVDAIPHAIVARLDSLGAQLEQIRQDVEPLRELSAVRAQLDALRPAVDRLGDKLDGLRDEIEPVRHLPNVRAGIEPLDDDLRQVRESIDTIEPFVKGIGSQLHGIDGKLSEMSGDLAPVGDLAEKVPGVTRSKAKPASR
jgi:chromosome segregation ATPase